MTLVERLRRRHECRECHQTTVHHLINPDGPEAADALETAEKALDDARLFVELVRVHWQNWHDDDHEQITEAKDCSKGIDAALEKIRSGR
jgi:hypothetical protein